jgi:hypothetical protein
MRVRRLLPTGLAAAAVGVGAFLYVTRSPADAFGPLQPSQFVESFGTTVDDGSTISFVVQYRGETPATALLESASLVDPDPGLVVTSASILVSPFTGYVIKSFPPGDVRPLEGATYTTSPDDASGDLFIVLGIRTELAGANRSAHGVWLAYSVDGSQYRALLPWLLTVCPAPSTKPCPNQDPASFQLPTPGS